MHRSGTSLFTNWLQTLGLEVGDRLLNARRSNLKGHFEDLDFLELHEQILSDNKCSAFDQCLPLRIDPSHKLRANELVDFKSKLYQQWGWKDPRTCLFLDFWEQICPGANKIVIFRDFKDVVQSLVNRDLGNVANIQGRLKIIKRFLARRRIITNIKKVSEFYLDAWCCYNEQLIIGLKEDKKTFFINISDLHKYEDAIFDHLVNTLDLKLEHNPFSSVFEKKLWRKNHLESALYFPNEKVLKAESILESLKNIQKDRMDLYG